MGSMPTDAMSCLTKSAVMELLHPAKGSWDVVAGQGQHPTSPWLDAMSNSGSQDGISRQPILRFKLIRSSRAFGPQTVHGDHNTLGP